MKKDNQGAKCLEASIQGKKVLVTEDIIREALQIGDKREFTKEIELDETQEFLRPNGF